MESMIDQLSSCKWWLNRCACFLLLRAFPMQNLYIADAGLIDRLIDVVNYLYADERSCTMSFIVY